LLLLQKKEFSMLPHEKLTLFIHVLASFLLSPR
jgi:hypothetical protein